MQVASFLYDDEKCACFYGWRSQKKIYHYFNPSATRFLKFGDYTLGGVGGGTPYNGLEEAAPGKGYVFHASGI